MSKKNANNVPMDPLSKAFGLEPMDGKLKPNGKIMIPDPNDDYEYSRQSIIDILEQGSMYMKQFGEVALSAQEPRHFEVLNNMMNTLIDGHVKLIDLKAADNNIKERIAKNEQANQPNVQNNLVIGSTDDMIEMLEAMEERKTKKALKHE